MRFSDDLHVVKSIERLLSEVVELQKNFVTLICPQCLNPCCKKVNFLFCEKDTLFLKLSGRPTWRREASKKNGCRFLGSGGCTLDPISRPFTCHRYICPDLEKEITKQQPGLLVALEKKFNTIDNLRSKMWTKYLEKRM